MIRKLAIAAVLVIAAIAAAPQPAPAIDFICSCNLCKPGSSLACRDFTATPLHFTSCGDYYIRHCS